MRLAFVLRFLLWAPVFLPLGVGEVRGQAAGVQLGVPRVVLSGVPFTATVRDPAGDLGEGSPLILRVGENTYEVTIAGAETAIEGVVASADEALTLVDEAGATVATAAVAPIPGWFAILPAVIAIVVALALRQVIAALFLGIWLGAALVYGTVAGVWFGLLDVITDYVRNAVTDSGQSSCSR
jgi:hypothetical protein